MKPCLPFWRGIVRRKKRKSSRKTFVTQKQSRRWLFLCSTDYIAVLQKAAQRNFFECVGEGCREVTSELLLWALSRCLFCVVISMKVLWIAAQCSFARRYRTLLAKTEKLCFSVTLQKLCELATAPFWRKNVPLVSYRKETGGTVCGIRLYVKMVLGLRKNCAANMGFTVFACILPSSIVQYSPLLFWAEMICQQ